MDVQVVIVAASLHEKDGEMPSERTLMCDTVSTLWLCNRGRHFRYCSWAAQQRAPSSLLVLVPWVVLATIQGELRAWVRSRAQAHVQVLGAPVALSMNMQTSIGWVS